MLNGGADQTSVGDLDASFGGVVLKGYRDHFWLYDYANNAWNTSDNVNLSCETGLLIDNRKALDEHKVRFGNRTKGGMVYLGSGEHDTWRIGTNHCGDLIFEYRRLDGQWVEKHKISLNHVDTGAAREEAANPYIERTGQTAKKPTVHDPNVNLGNEFWPLFRAPAGEKTFKVKLFLNTDDAFALGRIMKRTVNSNGVIPGPVIIAKPGDVIEIDFYNELDDLGELEPWNDGMMQRHEMVHAHIDDRKYSEDGTISESEHEKQDLLNQAAVTWMSHVMMRGGTNLHTHGFHVTPGGFGDNVLRTSKPGSRLRHRYKLPGNHFGGLQWYHPHGHGGSMNLITRGGMGLILIEGPYQQRLNSSHVEREYFVLQRIDWADDLNGHDELNWVDYVSTLPLDMLDTSDPSGFDLQLMPWGNGSGVPGAGQNLVIAGLDADGMIHIRKFDFAGVATDIYEVNIQNAPNLVMATTSGVVLTTTPESDLLRNQQDAISYLRLRLPDLTSQPALDDTVKAKVLTQLMSLAVVKLPDGQQFTPRVPQDLSPYYRDNLDPKCICSCAALEGAPDPNAEADHSHGNFSMATPECKAAKVRWVPAVNGQKQPVFHAKLNELKIFSMVNGTGITFFRVSVKDHHIVVACRDGIPWITANQPPLSVDPIDPDFVRLPAGQRLNYVICNSGQRFEFFLRPDPDATIVEGDYPIYMLPISEKEIFGEGEWTTSDLKVQIATLRYSGTLEATAPNHLSNLASLLPKVTDDNDPGGENTDLPVDRTGWEYITSVDDLKKCMPTIEATVYRAVLTLDGSRAKIVMPPNADGSPQAHHLPLGHEIRIQNQAYVIDALDDEMSTFFIKVPDDVTRQLPTPGTVDFQYDLYQWATINNSQTHNQDWRIINVLTDHYYYRGIPLDKNTIDGLKKYVIRQRTMNFDFHKRGLAKSGADSTEMNGNAFNDFLRTVAYLGTNEEIVIENLTDVIHLFHIHINYFQVMGYRDASFAVNAANGVTAPPSKNFDDYRFDKEIPVPFEGFEDTTTIPPGAPEGGGDSGALPGKRGQVRVRISHEDYTGLFLMHCHLLDDQDMGMMQEVEVVAPNYIQAPYSEHRHSHMM